MDDQKPHLVVLSGAGISAESGLQTFRDSDGLWEGYDVMQVATPQGWARNPALVLEFYNQRRRQARKAVPNQAHLTLAELESRFLVSIVTQNVDDLHERAGSSFVLHLHGELRKARSTVDPRLVYTIDGTELNLGDTCEKGSQLRPHIVWFGEEVPLMEQAIEIAADADIFLIIGTSLAVYPAAGLIDFVRPETSCILIDPNPPRFSRKNLIVIQETATAGIPNLLAALS